MTCDRKHDADLVLLVGLAVNQMGVRRESSILLLPLGRVRDAQ